MTISEKVGDIFTSEAPVLAHGCNLEGGEVGGIAKVVFDKFPAARDSYDAALERGSRLGDVDFAVVGDDGEIIANMFTQGLSGPHADIDAIASCLHLLHISLPYLGDRAAIPRIGAGIGGLEWDDVYDVIVSEFEEDENVEIEIWTLPDAPKS